MNWVIYALLSAIFAALVAIFGKVGLKSIDSTLATTIRSVVMAVFLVVLAFGLGKFRHLSELNNRVLLYIVISGIAGALSWLFYFYALKTGPATGVAALDRSNVVFVLILAAIFLSEAITWKTGIGALLVAIGAFLISLK